MEVYRDYKTSIENNNNFSYNIEDKDTPKKKSKYKS